MLLNMVKSLDGTATVNGVSGALSSPADSEVFSTLRSLADVILVAAGTVRDENYGPPSLPQSEQDRRASAGQKPLPELAVVSASLNLNPDSRLFEDGHKPLIFTGAPSTDTTTSVSATSATTQGTIADTATTSTSQLQDMANIIHVPVDSQTAVGQTPKGVDFNKVRQHLSGLGHKVILCEGGPSLNAQLISRGLLDEICLSLAPQLVGGKVLPVFGGLPGVGRHLRLQSVVTDGATLFLRYLFQGSERPDSKPQE